MLLGDFTLERRGPVRKLSLARLSEETVEHRGAAALTRSRTARPSASEMRVTRTRLGKKRVRVLRLEWLTLLPNWTALPVSSQRRDIANDP